MIIRQRHSDMKTKNSVIIVAASKGSRMSGDTKKQFLKLGGKLVLNYSLEFFDKCHFLEEIILVVAKEDIEYCRELVSGYNKISKIVVGGNTRQESVFNGLKYLDKDTDIVVVHDAARPHAATLAYCRDDGTNCCDSDIRRCHP